MREQLLNWVIGKQEDFLGAPLNYLREISRLSTAAFLKIAMVAPIVRHRRRLPRTAYHLATLTVIKHEDCGGCVQIAENLARKEGVPSAYIRSALDGQFCDLPETLGEVCEFARHVAEGWDSDDLRDRLRGHYGDEGVMELALAISTARAYPTLKRAMGYSQNCSLARVAV